MGEREPTLAKRAKQCVLEEHLRTASAYDGATDGVLYKHETSAYILHKSRTAINLVSACVVWTLCTLGAKTNKCLGVDLQSEVAMHHLYFRLPAQSFKVLACVL